MLIEKIRKVTLRNNLVRIECITYAPDGEEQLSGVMHIPANQAGELVQSLNNSIQQLQQQLRSAQGNPGPGQIGSQTLKIGECNVHFRRAVGEGKAVVLLHGAKFTASNWEELGTLKQLSDAGYAAWAMDLPGYGESEQCQHPNVQVVASFMRQFEQKPVLVGPSMSGKIALDLALAAPDCVSGLVLIAPTGVQELSQRLSEISIPTLVVWGDQDSVVPVDQADILRDNLPNAKVSIFEGGQHPCYLDQPEKWHEELLAFLKEQ